MDGRGHVGWIPSRGDYGQWRAVMGFGHGWVVDALRARSVRNPWRRQGDSRTILGAALPFERELARLDRWVLWLVHRSAWYSRDGQHWTHWDGAAEAHFFSLGMADGRAWMGTDQGLVAVGEDLKADRFAVSPPAKESWQSRRRREPLPASFDRVSAVKFDSTGRIWEGEFRTPEAMARAGLAIFAAAMLGMVVFGISRRFRESAGSQSQAQQQAREMLPPDLAGHPPAIRVLNAVRCLRAS